MPSTSLPPVAVHWRHGVPTLVTALAAAATAAMVPLAAAQGTEPRVSFTSDPMRPSPVAAAGAMPLTAAAGTAATDAVDDSGLPRLEATHRSAAGRRAALIDGRWRAVGDTVGELRVASVGEADVVLTRGGERVTLSLLTVRTRPSSRPRAAEPRNTRGAAE